MPSKDQHSEIQVSTATAEVSLKRLERFLRLLTWQLFFMIAFLAYLMLRPQPGRYQFIVGRDEVMVFDTAWSQVVQVKLQKREVTPGEKVEPGTQPAEGESK